MLSDFSLVPERFQSGFNFSISRHFALRKEIVLGFSFALVLVKVVEFCGSDITVLGFSDRFFHALLLGADDRTEALFS